MKKTLAILSVLATAAAFASEVESGNTFGYVPVTCSEGLKAISVPLAGYSVSGSESIKIAEILQTTGLAQGDALYTLADGGKYNEYTLQSDGTWMASRVVTVGTDGKFVLQEGTPATVATIERGKAFWLNTKATQVNLIGQATTGTTEFSLTSGWNLIGSTSMTAPLAVSSIEAGAGSRLNVGSKSYQKGKKSWLRLPNYEALDATDVIPVGVGAMLLKK